MKLNHAERKGISYRVRKSLEQMADKSDMNVRITKVFVRENGTCRICLDLDANAVEQTTGELS